MIKEEKGVVVFGKFFSNKKLFWNGFSFLLIGAIYETISIGNQLPYDWKESGVSIGSVKTGIVIPVVFFIVSYIIFDRRFFGGNPIEAINKFGYIGYFLRKLFLIIGLVFLNLTLKSILLITLF